MQTTDYESLILSLGIFVQWMIIRVMNDHKLDAFKEYLQSAALCYKGYSTSRQRVGYYVPLPDMCLLQRVVFIPNEPFV